MTVPPTEYRSLHNAQCIQDMTVIPRVYFSLYIAQCTGVYNT